MCADDTAGGIIQPAITQEELHNGVSLNFTQSKTDRYTALPSVYRTQLF
jgi:hypothetical protein